MKQEETALVQVGPVEQQAMAQVITDPQSLAAQVRALSEKAIVLSPVTQVSAVLPKHQVAMSVVVIDPEIPQGKTTGPEVYQDRRFCDADEVALGKVALLKLMRAAGIQMVSKERLDDQSDPYLCWTRMTLAMRDYATGQWDQHIVDKELDLRDGAPETQKPERKKEGSKWVKTGRMVPMAASAIADARRHIVTLCSTKCLTIGIRQMLNLQQKYKKKTLEAMPFVVPKLAPYLDPSDPDDKKALLQMATGGAAALYGDPQQEPTRLITEGSDVVDASTGEVTAEVRPAAAAPEPEPDDLDNFTELPTPARLVCTCPCGCQAELSQQVHDLTMERVGGARCRVCFPGKSFDHQAHKDLQDLGLTTEEHGLLTPEKVKELLARG